MNTADTIAQREAYNWAGWVAVDDDCPKPPELSPLASAQARRAWRASSAAKDLQRQPR